MESMVTEYKEICSFRGRLAEAEHHIIFGATGRELSEKDVWNWFDERYSGGVAKLMFGGE